MKDFHQTLTGLKQYATGSITITDYAELAGKTVTVGANTLTEGADFTAATSNNATASSLATAINALAAVNASATGAVVTVNNDAVGAAGNSKVLQTNATSGITLSGATLAGGVDATYTEVFDFSGEDKVDNVELEQIVQSLSGSSPTVDTTPQYSLDKENWKDNASAFAQKTGTGSETLEMNTTGLFVRSKIVLGGTNTVAGIKINGVAK